MTHLPYIAAAYAIAVLVPVYLSLESWQRLRAARRKLAAIDTRRDRGRRA